MKICPHCESSFDSDVRFCPRDGTVLRELTGPQVVAGGMVAGRYEILQELGRGGAGVVYLARHIQMERLCALKVLLRDSLVNPDAVARFHREARNASRISHPNVVAVYDFGETEDGTAFLAMEYVEGKSLAAVLADAGPFTPRRAARIVWQIANGLTVAHDLQIVHRDLKPGNIMLTRYRAWEDFVKVVDFGIAKAFGSSGSTVTATGLAMGTPGYMSPEQWTGPDLDHRSDIYSLAMITVRMLAGEPPANKYGLPIAGDQMLQKLPAAAGWPADLKAVLVRGLDPDPEKRFASVSEFAHALVTAVTRWVPATPGEREPWDERLTPSGSETASGSGSGARASRSRRILTGVGAAAALGIVGWIVLSLSSGRESVAGNNPDSLQARADSSVIPSSNPVQDQPKRSNDPPGGSPPPSPPAAPPPAAQPPAAVPAPVKQPVWADSAAALEAVIDLDRPDAADSARQVVTRANRLLRQPLADSVRVEVNYRLAEARLVLGEEAAACRVLHQIDSVALRIRYLFNSIRELLSRTCK